MATRLTSSTAHRLIVRPDRYHLALAFFRLQVRVVEQLRLELRRSGK